MVWVLRSHDIHCQELPLWLELEVRGCEVSYVWGRGEGGAARAQLRHTPHHTTPHSHRQEEANQ
eukprot:11889289-Prorocentrum_lima.AAC.1